MKNNAPQIYIHTLGCSKNIVDSEELAAQARASSIKLASTPERADVIIINTCGFIEAAKQESIDHILQAVDLKQQGALKKVVVMGCLSERYAADLKSEIPEVDAYFGSHHLPEVLAELGGRYRTELIGERELSTPKHFAYLKISEGCDNPCSFCAIPLMRGGHVSKPLDQIKAEAQRLRAKGTRELILIAQDLTYYGLDLYGKRRLADVLRCVSDVGFDWIRLLYAYPADFPVDILPVMRERENICNYLDMPIQHTQTEVLRSMKRRINEKKLGDLLSRIRDEVPDIRLRTTLITGYPNETETHFEALLDFLRDIKFDRLGVFPYSQEDDTGAYPLGDPISEEEKMRRVRAIMSLQEDISMDKNMELIDQELNILVDQNENGVVTGRTEFDCPEVDHEFVIQSAASELDLNDVQVGQFYRAKVTDVEAFDLFGELVS